MPQLGYLSDAFVYVVDKRAADADKFEFSGRFPGSLGLAFASSSVDDAVLLHDARAVLEARDHLTVAWQPTNRHARPSGRLGTTSSRSATARTRASGKSA